MLYKNNNSKQNDKHFSAKLEGIFPRFILFDFQISSM